MQLVGKSLPMHRPAHTAEQPLELMFASYARPCEVFTLQSEDLVEPAKPDEHYALNLFPDDQVERSKVVAANESIMLDSP